MSFQNTLSLNTSGHHCPAETGHLLQQLASLYSRQRASRSPPARTTAGTDAQAAELDNIMLEVEAITPLAAFALCLLQNWLLVVKHS